MKISNLPKISFVLFCLSLPTAHASELTYSHSALKYTPAGVEIYSMPAKDFLAKGFAGQVEHIKNFKNWMNIRYVLGQTGSIVGSDANDYFYGFDNYRNNELIGGKWDDFYEIQHTYPIVEKSGEGTDTYFTSGNTGPGKANVENLVSAGPGGRIYGGSEDNLIIAEGLGSEIHGGGGNDVLIVNGTKDSYFGEDGIDTIVFSGPLADYAITGDPWGVTVKNTKTGWDYRLGHHDIEQFQFDDAFFGYEAGANTLRVGPSRSFKKTMDALHVAGNGDTIEVDAGTYEDDFAIIDRSVTIRWINGRARFFAKSETFKGKANFITMNADVTFDSVEFSGNRASDRNGAGIRMEGSIPGGTVTVKNSYFHDNEVGILAGNQSNGVLNIENTEFGPNGRTSGTVHTVNVGVIKELNVKNSFFHDSMNGHNIRSLANSLRVTDSFFYDGNANTSFNIEMAQAQNSVISGNTFVQTEYGENTHMIFNTASISSTISRNIFINLSSRGVSAINNGTNQPISLDSNQFSNYRDFVGGTGKYAGNGNTVLASVNVAIPATMAPAGSNATANPVSPAVISSETEFDQPATLEKFTGKSLYVGVGKAYSNLKDAVLAANSGDIVYVDEWTYSSDYVTVSNKNLAIVGLGKGAEFKKVAAIPNGKAIFVSYRSNLLVKNIAFLDAEVPDKNGAGIRYEGGTLTVVNGRFENNENGILGGATEIGKGKIWIRNSKFLNNGRNWTGYTHAIYIGEIDFFEIRNSTVRGTSVGHHVKSRARSNVIENNLLDDADKDASYNIDLPNGGEALVRGNTILQSAASGNRTMVSYCAEKNPPNPGKLTVENNAFESLGTPAVGVKNFRDNPVILRNNTFKNVAVKFSGNGVTEENSNPATGQGNPTGNGTAKVANPAAGASGSVSTSGTGSVSVPMLTGSTTAISTGSHSISTGSLPTATTPIPSNSPNQPEFIASSKIKLLPENSDVGSFREQIDAHVQRNIENYQLSAKKIRAIERQLDKKIRKMEIRNTKKRLNAKENREYFLMLMYRNSLKEKRGK